MIYLRLFWEFLRIGMFSIGGGYASIPLIREAVMQNGWMDEALFANLLAISESTPGPVMVNMATYVGSRQAGLFGAALSTLGVVLPAFVILLLIVKFLSGVMQRRGVQAVFQGVRPCVTGIILATGVSMALSACLPTLRSPDPVACGIFLLLLAVSWLYRRKTKKEFSPIGLILIAAVCGMVLYSI